MAFSPEESSPVAYITDSCCICDEEFSSDSELASHLLEHTHDEEFIACLSDDSASRNSLPVTPTRVFPEFTSTTFVKGDLPRRSIMRRPSSPEVWEIVSDDSDDNSKPPQAKQRRASSFRLVSSPNKPLTSTPIPTPTPGFVEGGPPYKCRHCSVVSVDVKSFKEHLQSHEKPRPYSCDICNKTFAYKGTLRQHLHLHIGEKLHACKICNKRFTLKSVLRKHEESHEMPIANTNGQVQQ